MTDRTAKADAALVKVMQVWTNANKDGNSGIYDLQVPTCCLNFVGPFVDSISSIQVFSGFTCAFFT